MKLITPELEARFVEVGNQSEARNPLIVAKFFDPVGSATWYATEYNPNTRICYGYVTGLAYDEWGTFSIDELESIQRPFGLTIERDIHFDEKMFYQQFPQQLEKRVSELKEINSKNHQNQDLER